MRIANITTIITLLTLILTTSCKENNPPQFNSQHAYDNIEYQLSLGPRTIGSEAHQTVVEWAVEELTTSGWNVTLQTSTVAGKFIQNIIAKRNDGAPWIILGAHYDTRFYADRDPDLQLQNQPVPGANDGASGVAVLLELARILPKDLGKTVWIVLFDAEDNGAIPGWDWIMGSQLFMENLSGHPDAVVIIDMIGDSDLNIYKERNSTSKIVEEIWNISEELGYLQFQPEYKYQIIDDHIPFLRAGIPAVDIIDMDYPYWHTTHDTLDKISSSSLKAVGDVLFTWITR